MAESIEQLRIYQDALRLEDEVYELVKTFPADQFYGLGNDLRRSGAAVSHHIMDCHRLYSYRLKLDELSAMRREAEATQGHLERARDLGATDELIEGYTSIIKQSLGLTKWLQAKLNERRQKEETVEAHEGV
jgi:four helix bundle protein